MIPDRDLRDVYADEMLPDEEEIEFLPEFDPRFLESAGAQPYPWTFDEVPLSQAVKCKVGMHKGRIESLGGDPCFVCSYCGEIVR